MYLHENIHALFLSLEWVGQIPGPKSNAFRFDDMDSFDRASEAASGTSAGGRSSGGRTAGNLRPFTRHRGTR